MLYAVCGAIHWFSQFLFTHRPISCFFSIFLHYYRCINRKNSYRKSSDLHLSVGLWDDADNGTLRVSLLNLLTYKVVLPSFLSALSAFFHFRHSNARDMFLATCFQCTQYKVSVHTRTRNNGKNKTATTQNLSAKFSVTRWRKKIQSLNGNKNANNALSVKWWSCIASAIYHLAVTNECASLRW